MSLNRQRGIHAILLHTVKKSYLLLDSAIYIGDVTIYILMLCEHGEVTVQLNPATSHNSSFMVPTTLSYR